MCVVVGGGGGKGCVSVYVCECGGKEESKKRWRKGKKGGGCVRTLDITVI